jgi:putative flippase GtrA
MHWRDIHPKVIGLMSFKKVLESERTRYLIVGAVTATVYFGTIALCLESLLFEYRLSVSIAYFIAVTFHFLANRKYTFAAQNRPVRSQIIRYIILLLVNYMMTFVLISFMVNQLDISHYKSAFVAIVATVAVGYLASKFLIFN